MEAATKVEVVEERHQEALLRGKKSFYVEAGIKKTCSVEAATKVMLVEERHQKDLFGGMKVKRADFIALKEMAAIASVAKAQARRLHSQTPSPRRLPSPHRRLPSTHRAWQDDPLVTTSRRRPTPSIRRMPSPQRRLPQTHRNWQEDLLVEGTPRR